MTLAPTGRERKVMDVWYGADLRASLRFLSHGKVIAELLQCNFVLN